MRITVVGPVHPFKGGIAQHTARLVSALAARGHDVTVETWRRQYPARLYPGQLTVEAPEFPPHRPTKRDLAWNRPDTWWRVGRRSRRSDVVIVAHVSPFHAAPLRVLLGAAAGAGRRVVVAHNVFPHERKPLDRTLVRLLLRAPDAVVTHGEHEAALARGITAAEVAMAPLPPHFPPGFRPGRPAPGTHHRLLFFGLVRPYKGLDIALRALATGPEQVRLRVAGEFWGGRGETEALIDELGVGDRVELIPQYIEADRVPALFADVDALVLPYRSATGSQGVWTAFQFGVPVITTDAGGLARDVTRGVDGLVVPAGDADALAGALHDFYRPGVPERMRVAVRPVDPEPYWDQYVAAVLGGAG